METMPLFSRFFGSLIDKFIIAGTFVVSGILMSPFGFSGDFGVFTGLMGTSPGLYPYMPSSTDYMAIDRSMAGLFIIINLLYYTICESLLKASFGKVIFSCHIVNERKEQANAYNIFLRLICLAALLVIAVYFMHFSMGMTYNSVIILYFLVLDMPVFFTRQSLIDICTGTMYVKQ